VRASALTECTLRIVFLANPYDNHRCCPPLCVLRLPTPHRADNTPRSAAGYARLAVDAHCRLHMAHALISELLTTTRNSVVGSSRALAYRSFKLFSSCCLISTASSSALI